MNNTITRFLATHQFHLLRKETLLLIKIFFWNYFVLCLSRLMLKKKPYLHSWKIWCFFRSFCLSLFFLPFFSFLSFFLSFFFFSFFSFLSFSFLYFYFFWRWLMFSELCSNGISRVWPMHACFQVSSRFLWASEDFSKDFFYVFPGLVSSP